MIQIVRIGVPKLGAKLFLCITAFLVLLTGCGLGRGQGAEASVHSTPTSVLLPTPTSGNPIASDSETATPPAAIVSSSPAVAAEPTPVLSAEPSSTATASVCPYLYGRTEIGTLTSSAMGEQPRFLVHLPPCYEQYPTKAFPTVYLFHGWPLDEWHWINLGIADWADDWISRSLVGPFIIVLPGVSTNGLYVNSSGGDDSFEGFVVNELVPQVDASYRTIRHPSGRAVGGISRGGVWALEIALRHQDLFGSVGGHSPALAVNNPLPQYDPFRLIQEDVSGLRFYLDAGDVDWTRAGVIRMRDDLLEVGADVIYEVHQGNHVDSLWQSAMPDYIRFYGDVWPRVYDALPEWPERDQPLPP